MNEIENIWILLNLIIIPMENNIKQNTKQEGIYILT